MDFRGPPDQSRRDIIDRLLERLPPEESDYIRLYYMLGKRQDDIAKIFSRTQADISYRLIRGVGRIQFLMTLPLHVDEKLIRKHLTPLFPPTPDGKTLDMNILVGIFHTTCQSYVARENGVTQGKVRHRFFRALKIVCERVLDIVRDEDIITIEPDPAKDRLMERMYLKVGVVFVQVPDGFHPMIDICRVFVEISKNFNVLRGISYPQFEVPPRIIA